MEIALLGAVQGANPLTYGDWYRFSVGAGIPLGSRAVFVAQVWGLRMHPLTQALAEVVKLVDRYREEDCQ